MIRYAIWLTGLGLVFVLAGCAANSSRSRPSTRAAAPALSTGSPNAPSTSGSPARRSQGAPSAQEFYAPVRSGPHDVAPAPDGGVWFTAQAAGSLGLLDPSSGATKMIRLGDGSAPHGVIAGPDGAAWVTDGG